MNEDNALMSDMFNPQTVEIRLDRTNPNGWRMWVNVDGQCRLRIYGIDPKTFSMDNYAFADVYNIQD
jgi:hypothetical protein